MREAISDTGPILHLHEIGRLNALGIFERLSVPGLVADELRTYGLVPLDLGVEGLSVVVVRVSETSRNAILADRELPPIHPADAEVFALAQDERTRSHKRQVAAESPQQEETGKCPTTDVKL